MIPRPSKSDRSSLGLGIITIVGFALGCLSSTASAQEGKPLREPLSFELRELESVSETTGGASIGDLNNDGHPDILLMKGRHWPLKSVVLLGDGKGNFKPGAPLPQEGAGHRSYSAPLADLNGDGHLDFILSNDRPDAKLVFVGDGKGNFTQSGTYGAPTWPTRNSIIADLNGDGFPDIATANRGSSSMISFNDGKGNFPDSVVLGPETSSNIVAADMDGNGSMDVVVAFRDNGQCVVYFNDGRGRFPHKEAFGPKVTSTRAMAVADMNKDGRLDIIACHQALGTFIYLNQGKGIFDAGKQLSGADAVPYSLNATDLNGDGAPEIIVGFIDAPGVIFWNDGSGEEFTQSKFGDGRGGIYGLAVADLNHDGLLDIVAARSGAPSFALFQLKGTQAPAK